jgi:VWFA-related protein
MKKQLLLALLLVLQFSFSIRAQQPSASPSPKPTATPQQPAATPGKPAPAGDEDVVRINTNLVQVDAVITDKNGKLVTDLRPEDVEISEDNRKQKITHFSYIVVDSAPASPARKPAPAVDKNAPPAPPVTLKPEEIRRTIAIVVDDLGLSFESTHFVRQALKKFVDEQMQPGDLVAIIRTGGGIGALQQFTSDKRMLYAAIERVRWYASGRGNIGAFAAMEPPTPGRGGPEMDAANEDLNQFREDVFAVGTLGAINYVVKGLRELPGRKSILLISDGFRIYNRDDPSRSYRALLALQRLIDQASRASVVIYTMNATGLQTMGLTAADNTGGMTPEQVEQQLSSRRTTAFDSQAGLDYLARETGGIAIRNTNDLSGGIKRILEDQKSYYLIGYRPDESTFDPKTGRRTFHHLKLKVTRTGKYNVRMRNGFFGVSDEEVNLAARTPQRRMIDALISPFGSAGVHLRLTSLFANDLKLGSFMRSLLHINAGDLTFTDESDGSHKAKIDFLAITFGDNGTPIEQITGQATLTVRADRYKQVLKEGLVYFVTVPIKKAGAYQLRIAVRDQASERIGSASQFVDVPDIKKNRLTVSGVILTAVEPAALKKQQSENASSAGSQAPAGQNTGRDETMSATNNAAVRQFNRGQIMQYGVVIYNARVDKSTAQPQLQVQVRLFRGGQNVFTGKQQPFVLNNAPDLKRLAANGAIQLGADMALGEYVLQVVVTDLLADEKHRIATQWIDFEIVK